MADVTKEYIRDRDYSLKDSEYLIIGQRGALRRDAISNNAWMINWWDRNGK